MRKKTSQNGGARDSNGNSSNVSRVRTDTVPSSAKSNSPLSTKMSKPSTSRNVARTYANSKPSTDNEDDRPVKRRKLMMEDASLSVPSEDSQSKSKGSSSSNAVAANAAKNVHRYQRKIPEIWKHNVPATTKSLYPTILQPETHNGQNRAPMLMLTRTALPELASFSVFYAGVPCNVRLTRGAAFVVDERELNLLHGFTIRICRTVLNKPFSCTVAELAYFLAPVSTEWIEVNQPDYSDIKAYIAWDIVQAASVSHCTPLLPIREGISLDHHVQDIIVQDRASEFTNRFYVTSVRHDLTPLSKADDSPREANHASFLEYCNSRRNEPAKLKDDGQPMLQVSPISVVVNNLSPVTASTATISQNAYAPAKYLIPELSFRLSIPASVLRTALLLPSITRRIDDQLIVKEANAQFFNQAIDENYLLFALTPTAACVEFNYERLELLGDAILKYLCSIYCFNDISLQHEGALHTARQKLISNNSLLAAAFRINFPPFILSKPLVVKLWQPSNPYLASSATNPPAKIGDSSNDNRDSSADQTAANHAGKRGKRKRQRDEQDFQWLGDKTVADVVEAIVGAAFLTDGQDTALKTAKALGLDLPRVEQWADFQQSPTSSPKGSPQLPKNTLTAVEAILGCHFSYPHLLSLSLTHASLSEHDYQRLEYLGDAILDFLTVRYIFDDHPQLSPGGISLLKAAMVSNHTLAALCVHLGLHPHIQHTQSQLSNNIKTYSTRLRSLKKAEYELAYAEQRSPGQYWLEIEPPKVLSDVMEAIVGALFVSEGYSVRAAEAIFNRLFKPFYDEHINLRTLTPHPNTALFEFLQAEHCHQHRLEKFSEGLGFRYEVVVHDVVLASMSHPTATIAMRSTAYAALDALAGDPGFLARTCDCRSTGQTKKTPKGQKEALGYSEETDGAS